jgi:hypothetical protein
MSSTTSPPEIANASFQPVPRSSERHDGWTEACQRQFIDALSQYGIVRAAAAKVGKCHASAYRLRRSEGAESFAQAWDEALAIGMTQLQDIAMDRAINGIPVPHFYKGEKIGESVWHDNKLLMFMVAQTNTRRFGKHAAEYDFVDETLRVEAEQEAKRVAALAKAEELMAQLEELMEEMEAAGTQIPEVLHDRQAELYRVIADLRAVDTHRAKEAEFKRMMESGRFSVNQLRKFKKRMGLGP